MTKHAFSELNFLKLKVLKKLKNNPLKNIFLISKRKKNSLNLKKYLVGKNQNFLKFLFERNQWLSYSEFLISLVFLWKKIGKITKMSNGENLENFLKNIPMKFLEKITQFFFIMSKSKVFKDFSIERMIFFNFSIKESKGKLKKTDFLKKNNDNHRFFLTTTPENFQIYVEQLRINIDQRNFLTAGVIINDKIKDLFSNLSLKKSRLCLFEQIIRNLIKSHLKNQQLCKLYAVRFKELEKKNLEDFPSTTEFYCVFFYFLIQKTQKRNSSLFEIVLYNSIIKKKKLFIQFLALLFAGQLIIWSELKSKLFQILIKNIKFSKNFVFFLLRKIRAEIILNNIKILSKSFQTVFMQRLSEILEIDLIDLQLWIHHINKFYRKKFWIDRLTGKCFFNTK